MHIDTIRLKQFRGARSLTLKLNPRSWVDLSPSPEPATGRQSQPGYAQTTPNRTP
jgi:hypothetical protein